MGLRKKPTRQTVSCNKLDSTRFASYRSRIEIESWPYYECFRLLAGPRTTRLTWSEPVVVFLRGRSGQLAFRYLFSSQSRSIQSRCKGDLTCSNSLSAAPRSFLINGSFSRQSFLKVPRHEWLPLRRACPVSLALHPRWSSCRIIRLLLREIVCWNVCSLPSIFISSYVRNIYVCTHGSRRVATNWQTGTRSCAILTFISTSSFANWTCGKLLYHCL